MEDLARTVLMTAAIPGAIFGFLASIRSGFLMTLLGTIVGAIGGLGGGLGLPGLVGVLNLDVPNGPMLVIAGSILGALILLLLTSGLRQPVRT